MFADDATILLSNYKCDELEDFNSFLIQVSKLFRANQLVLNVEKTNVLKFTSPKYTFYPLNLFYANYSLTEAATITFLGLQLDSLTWKAHINFFLLNKLSSVCYIMERLVHILNLETLKVVYFAHFHSLISNGIIFRGNSPTMQKVFLVQKRI
jgi:hypothetical protein